MKASLVNTAVFKPNGFRVDASFHLSEAVLVRRKISASPYKIMSVGDVSENIFYGNRAKRVYVQKRENGIPFLSSSDILQADLENVKLASKKYTPQIEQMRLKEGWILVSRSGTIGNTAWATKQHAQKLASEDVIRIIPNNILRGGFVYAYLSTTYGHSLLTQGTFGAVIQHIEPDYVSSLPIPQFPAKFQEKVDNLIKESARLREEATEHLNEAKNKVKKALAEISCGKKNSSVSIRDISKSYTKRFEASYFISENRNMMDSLLGKYKCQTLDDWTERIFRPGIFKRDYVKNGVQFLGGADIMMAIPSSDKMLSFKQVSKMPELQIQKNWILATCGGTIGNVVYVDSHLEKSVISQHVIRIVPKKDEKQGFLYAFLNSEIGYKLITLFSFGSVIPQVEPHHLKRIPVPTLKEKIVEEIDSLVQQYAEKIDISKRKELQAISLVEKEIDGWNA